MSVNIIINEQHKDLIRQMIKEESREVTYYEFLSQLKNFLKDLLSNPVSSQLNDFWKLRGFSKKKLVQYLEKVGLIEKEEKINEDDFEEPMMDITYRIPKQNFERKTRRMYQKFFEKEEPFKLEEDDGGAMGAGVGATSIGSVGIDGANTLVVPMTKVQRRKIYKVTEK